jgi:hypothetical protein
LARAGLGRLTDVADPRDNEGGEKGTTLEEIVEVQRRKEKNSNENAHKNRAAHADDELSPNETESITEWFARLAKPLTSGEKS